MDGFSKKRQLESSLRFGVLPFASDSQFRLPCMIGKPRRRNYLTIVCLTLQVISSGPQLMCNSNSIVYDEKIFPQPKSFKSERFLEGDIDLKKQQVITFGLGKCSWLDLLNFVVYKQQYLRLKYLPKPTCWSKVVWELSSILTKAKQYCNLNQWRQPVQNPCPVMVWKDNTSWACEGRKLP